MANRIDVTALWTVDEASSQGGDHLLAEAVNAGLTLHCLRHSYVTHLIEDGYDALFVQQQAGHEYASTLAIYTSVSSDYKTRTLRAALDGAVTAATQQKAAR